MGVEEIKQFQLHLINEKKVSWSTYIQATAALRFLYLKTLGQAFMAEKIPFPKRPRYLPTVLSQDEVRRLLDATPSLKHRAMFMTLYGGGLRVSEACNLAIRDIDSSRMVIHIRQAKGQKDRDVMLSPVLLETLRQYCKRNRPKGWLFPGNSSEKPITTKAVFLMIRKSAAKAEIARPCLPTCSATVLQLICWRREQTFELSNCYWGIRIWKPPSSIFTSHSSTFKRRSARWTRCPETK